MIALESCANGLDALSAQRFSLSLGVSASCAAICASAKAFAFECLLQILSIILLEIDTSGPRYADNGHSSLYTGHSRGIALRSGFASGSQNASLVCVGTEYKGPS